MNKILLLSGSNFGEAYNGFLQSNIPCLPYLQPTKHDTRNDLSGIGKCGYEILLLSNY